MPVLQANYTWRAAGEADAAACAELGRAFDAAHCPDDSTGWTAGDILADWAWLDPARDTWLAVAPDNTLAGYATLTTRAVGEITADGYVHPQHEGRGIGTALLHATEARAREVVAALPPDQHRTLINNIVATSPRACALLERYGYHQTRVFWRMRIDMGEQPPAPAWPAGIICRTCGDDDDIRRVYTVTEAAFADHWGHTPATYAEFRRWHIRDKYDPALWFLAQGSSEAPGWTGDDLAGVALCYAREDGTGWVNTLAVAREWRGRGLGTALLRAAFGAFWQRGITRVGLGVDATSLTGAQRLYERAGMRVASAVARYEKPLRPARDTGSFWLYM